MQLNSKQYLFFCSRDGVEEGIDWLVEAIKRNTAARPPQQKEITWRKLVYCLLICLFLSKIDHKTSNQLSKTVGFWLLYKFELFFQHFFMCKILDLLVFLILNSYSGQVVNILLDNKWNNQDGDDGWSIVNFLLFNTR